MNSTAKAAQPIPGPTPPAPCVLDTRPIFAGGKGPCDLIDEAVASLLPGQPLVLLVPFEPVPLYAKLSRQGFTHQSQQTADGSWRVEFRRRDADSPAAAPS